MSPGYRSNSEREQLELFRALPGDLAPRDAQDLMAYPFFSLAKTPRTRPIDFRTNDFAIPPKKSRAWRHEHAFGKGPGVSQ
jgi:plasmid replication initiation protein